MRAGPSIRPPVGPVGGLTCEASCSTGASTYLSRREKSRTHVWCPATPADASTCRSPGHPRRARHRCTHAGHRSDTGHARTPRTRLREHGGDDLRPDSAVSRGGADDCGSRAAPERTGLLSRRVEPPGRHDDECSAPRRAGFSPCPYRELHPPQTLGVRVEWLATARVAAQPPAPTARGVRAFVARHGESAAAQFGGCRRTPDLMI